jgi:hypothetical protein
MAGMSQPRLEASVHTGATQKPGNRLRPAALANHVGRFRRQSDADSDSDARKPRSAQKAREHGQPAEVRSNN